MKATRALIPRIRAIAACAVYTFALTAAADTELEPQEVELTTIEGTPIRPLRCTDEDKAAVVIFITTDCPIANSFVPEINRLYDQYSTKGVRITLIHADSDLQNATARKHAEEYSIQPAVAIDADHDLVKAIEARVTPEAFLFDAQGNLRYRGRINNLYTDLGKRRSVVTGNDLRDAIDAVLANREVPTPETEALGCYIETK